MKLRISLLFFVFALFQGFQQVFAYDFSSLRIAVLGDSMSWIGGENCQNEKGWTYHFNKTCHPAAMDIYARSGATWTNTSKTRKAPEKYSEVLDDDNVVYNQAIRLIENVRKNPKDIPEIIIIFAGANDAWFKKQRPGLLTRHGFNEEKNRPGYDAKPGDVTTLDLSIRLVCNLLKKNFPKSEIVLVTPIEMAKTSVADIRNVSDVIRAEGKNLDVKVLSADKYVEIRHDEEIKHKKNTYDGVHTNSRGAKLIASFIAEEINKLNKKNIK